MPILKEKDKEFLRRKFERELKGEVRVILFTSEDGCEFCGPAREIVEEVAGLSEKISAEFYDLERDGDKSESWGVDKAPAILIFGEREYGLRFFGLPSGYEFTAFIEDLVDASRGSTRLTPATKQAIKSIDKPVHIKVFVTPSCPYCPRVVRLAHQFAIENPNIRGDMIEAMEFQELASKYRVMAVPKTVINEVVTFEGAVPEPIFTQYVMKALGK